MKKYLILFLLNYVVLFSQCPFPATNTQLGTTTTFCVRNPNDVINVSNVTSQRFILVNIVKGFTYSFSVGDVFSSENENISIYNATNNSTIISNSGATGASITNWVATFSGQIKIVVANGNCLNSSIINFTTRLELVAVGNTEDNQNAMGTNTWVAHVYNWIGNAPPPGGAVSPNSPTNTIPFESSSYCGYYNINSENIAQNFGGTDNCFNVLSGGIIRTNVLSDVFAVRYKMRSTRPAGCYVATFRGDDGIRFYVDGVLTFSQWQQQGPTVYNNVLYYQDGDAELIFDFYEFQGQNIADFSFVPFNGNTNQITAPSITTVCSGVTPQTIDGTSYLYNGSAINPTIAYQWQISDDNVIWTNIPGATTEDYTPAAINAPSNSITKFYRRTVSAVSNSGNCSFQSNSISITTSGLGPTSTVPTANTASLIGCTNFTANWNAMAGATSYRIDVSTSNTFTSFIAGYNAFNTGNVTSVNVTGLNPNVTYYYRIRAIYSCGSSNLSNVINVSTLTTNTPTISISGLQCNEFNVNWAATANTTSYILDVSPVNNFATFIAGYNGLNVGNVTTFNVSGLSVSPVYVRVRAVGACFTTANSGTQTVNLNLTTWNGTAWSNGIPTLTRTAIINGNYDTTSLPDIDACNIIINSPFKVTISNNKYINLQDYVRVNMGGVFDIENNGSLVQINDGALNSGNITYKRITSVRLLDYVYWSSPVTNFPVSSVSPSSPAWAHFKWNPVVANTNGGQGNWEYANENMIIGKGYIIRAPLGYNPTNNTNYTASFIGIPNNGIISPVIQRGTYTGVNYFGTNGAEITNISDNFNLIGNPYPSAISAIDFLNQNLNIEGAIRIWTHGTLPSTMANNSFYNTFGYKYTSDDYIIYNQTGASTGPATFNGFIGAGQSFFVVMDDGPTANETVTFRNSMRRISNNNQFYKTSKRSDNNKRIWLDIIPESSQENINRILLGFDEEATDKVDRMFDATLKSDSKIYCFQESQKFLINSKSSFNIDQYHTLGIDVTPNQNYKIAIGSLQGFDNDAIFLWDKKINIFHDLKQNPYTFTSLEKSDNNRFEIRFRNSLLGENLYESNNTIVNVFSQGNHVFINAFNGLLIANLKIFDVSGRLIHNENHTHLSNYKIEMSKNQLYFVKGSLSNGKTFEFKVRH